MTGSLQHWRTGSGPPLILLHGLGHNRIAWEAVSARLAPHRAIVAVDLPGHGASPPIPASTPYTVANYVRTIHQHIKELQLGRVHVAGNSLGGTIALELAHTGCALSATALSPISLCKPAEAAYAAASLRSTHSLARLLRPLAPASLRASAVRGVLLAQFYGHPPRPAATEAVAVAYEFANASVINATVPYSRHYQLARQPAPPVPTTIAWGTRDRLLLTRQARRARQSMPWATHLWLPDCGHVPMPDNPATVAAVLLNGSKVQP